MPDETIKLIKLDLKKDKKKKSLYQAPIFKFLNTREHNTFFYITKNVY